VLPVEGHNSLSSRLMIWQSESRVIKDGTSDGHREFHQCKIALLEASRLAPKRMSTTNGSYLAGTAGALDQAFSDSDIFALLFGDCIADTMPSGKHLFLQEDRSDRIFGLIEGSVEISIYSIDGQKLVANVQISSARSERLTEVCEPPQRSAARTALSFRWIDYSCCGASRKTRCSHVRFCNWSASEYDG
jgi:hypothetical protein